MSIPISELQKKKERDTKVPLSSSKPQNWGLFKDTGASAFGFRRKF